MSHDELMYAHDERLFEAVVRHQRAAAAIVTRRDDDDEPRRIDVNHPATLAFRALVAGATVPRDRRREHERRALARLEELSAPEVILEYTRARADPQAALLQLLDAGLLPYDAHAIELSLRASLPLHEPYHQLRWLADPRRRDVLEEFADWPYVRHAEPDPAIDELLFGTSPLTVDDAFVAAFAYPYVTTRACRWHRVAALPRVRDFMLGLLQREPPPLEAYRRCYRMLHPMRFMDDTAEVPTGGALHWDYADFLARQQRFIAQLGRFLGRAQRRRWAVIVYIE